MRISIGHRSTLSKQIFQIGPTREKENIFGQIGFSKSIGRSESHKLSNFFVGTKSEHCLEFESFLTFSGQI